MNLNELVRNEKQKWEERMKMWYDILLFYIEKLRHITLSFSIISSTLDETYTFD